MAAPLFTDADFAEESKTNPQNWGLREDNTPKGQGFLGALKRPDGRVSTELSIGVNIDGKEVEIPALVPTLTEKEVSTLLNQSESDKIPRSIIDKAVSHARQRIASGKSPFATASETQTNLFPQFKRASIEAPSAPLFTDADFAEVKESKPEPSKVGVQAPILADYEQASGPAPAAYTVNRPPVSLPRPIPKPQPGEFAMLSKEEQRRAVEQMLDAEAAQEQLKETPGMLATIAREGGASILPSLAAGGGFALGAELGAPLGPVGSLLGGLGGSMLTGGAATDIQDVAARTVAPESAARFQDLLEAGRREHPVAAAAGRLAGALPSFQVSLPRTVAELGKRAALGAGISAIPAITEGRLPTAEELAEAAAFTAIYGEPRAKALRVPIEPMKGGEPNAIYEEANGPVRTVRNTPGESAQQVPIEGRSPEATPRGSEALAKEEIPIAPEVPSKGSQLDDVTKRTNEETQRQEEALRETVAPTTGAGPTAPEFTLTPAVEAEGRIFTGPNHADAIVHAAKNGIDALDAEHKFLGSDGEFYNRKEAGAIYEQKTGNKPKFEEGLHSTELEQAGLLDHVKGPGEVKPTAKAPPEQLTPATAESEKSKVQVNTPAAMAVGIAPPGTALAQAGIAKAARVINGIKTLFKSNPTRKIIDQTFDAADNKANNAGEQARNSLKIGTNRLEREAAMAIVEANGDPNKLAQFEQQVAGKDDRALAAVRYARQNWQRLQPLADRVSARLDEQLTNENAAGINTEYHEGYVPHIYDQDLLMGRGRPYILGGGGGKGTSTGFKKGRTFDTVFDAIEAGYKPKSIDVADLVEHRVKVGDRLVNRKAWAEALKQAVDPTDGNPIVADVQRKQRGPGGTWYETAPPGYGIKEIIPGVRVAWHNGYSSLFDALTGTSRISGSLPGQIALQTAGGIKHGLLVFDTFHASRIAQKELFLTGKVSYNKGKTLLEYADSDLNRAVRENLITPEIASWVRQNRPTANLLMDSGLNVGRVQESLYNSFVRQIPVLGTFNKWVFEKLTRGAMLESGLIEFERIKNAQPNLSDKQVAMKVSRDLNTYFGNLGRQGLFKSRQAQDIANLVALAPQWVESMAKTEAYGAAQAAKGVTIDPILHKTIMTGTIGKGVAQGLAAYFIGTQLLNLVTRKQPTWDNQEEGHKLDAWIPDLSGKGGPGFFLSPFSVVAELTHDMLRYSHKEGSALKAAARIASNKASPIWRAGKILLQGKDYNDRTIEDSWNRVKAAAWALAPVPIPAQAPLKTDYPGQAQRQLTASAGIKTEPAETATQQITAKADRYMKEIGKPKPKIERPEDEPTYGKLRNALRKGDNEEALKVIADLKKTKRSSKIAQAMQQNIRHPFTGSIADEIKFRRGLSEQERQLYDRAVEEKKAEYRKFLEIWKR